MNAVTSLVLQMACSVLVSLLVIRYINSVLREVLSQSCPQTGGNFWLRILNLLLVFAPLFLVVLAADPMGTESAFHELRATLLWMLFGQCLALLLLSRIIWRTLVVPGLNKQEA